MTRITRLLVAGAGPRFIYVPTLAHQVDEALVQP